MAELTASGQCDTAAGHAVAELQPTASARADALAAALVGPAYRDGEIVVYTSFDPSGYSIGQVVRRAPDDEQWSLCPDCGQQAVPGEQRGDLCRCPRCQTFVRFPSLGSLIYIRNRSGGRLAGGPFLVRQSQLRRISGLAAFLAEQGQTSA